MKTQKNLGSQREGCTVKKKKKKKNVGIGEQNGGRISETLQEKDVYSLENYNNAKK